MGKLASRALAIVLVSVATPSPLLANGLITDPGGAGYRAGIGPDGELFDDVSQTGLSNPAGSDYLRPGTPRDSWGITGSTGSAFADYQSFGSFGLAGTKTSISTNSARTVTATNGGLSVAQSFNFFAPNILSIQETVTNTNTFDVTGIVFRRDVDFDIFPTLFGENVFGPLGSNAQVIANSFYGFESPDPTVAFRFPCGVGCNATGDLGAGIDYSLGTLTPGETTTFAFYYGVNQPGQTLNQLFSQAQGLGLNYLIGAQSSENGVYPALGTGASFLGVSSLGRVVSGAPEPATWSMMLLGFGLIGTSLRRRQRTVSVGFAL